MHITKQKIIILISIIFLSFSLPFFSLARGLVPCGGYADDTTQTREPPCTVETIFVLIARVTNWLLSIVGLFAIFKIINAGFYLIISQGNEEAITKWKGAITNSIIGFVLALMAFMFVNTVVNFLLLRDPKNPKCRVDLTNFKTYLSTNQSTECIPYNTTTY